MCKHGEKIVVSDEGGNCLPACLPDATSSVQPKSFIFTPPCKDEYDPSLLRTTATKHLQMRRYFGSISSSI